MAWIIGLVFLLIASLAVRDGLEAIARLQRSTTARLNAFDEALAALTAIRRELERVADDTSMLAHIREDVRIVADQVRLQRLNDQFIWENRQLAREEALRAKATLSDDEREELAELIAEREAAVASAHRADGTTRRRTDVPRDRDKTGKKKLAPFTLSREGGGGSGSANGISRTTSLAPSWRTPARTGMEGRSFHGHCSEAGWRVAGARARESAPIPARAGTRVNDARASILEVR
jgi:hypothetical protein